MAKLEKMSKSRGNVITIDEVVHGVSELDPRFVFRYFDGSVASRLDRVWRAASGSFFCHQSPVFLCRREHYAPCAFPDGMQHKSNGDLWHALTVSLSERLGMAGALDALEQESGVEVVFFA